MMANPTPLATRTILAIGFVPEPHGKTHRPDALGAIQDEPGPATGSYPAAVAKLWSNVCVKTGPVPWYIVSIDKETNVCELTQFPLEYTARTRLR